MVNYDPSLMSHINTGLLKLLWWDENSQAWLALATTLDLDNHRASAETINPGHFNLQGPQICSEDVLEPNDNFNSASNISSDGTLVSSLFDIAQDEDWFRLYANAGLRYTAQISNAAAGVYTKVEIYDQDGITVLSQNENSGGELSSKLEWNATENGIYFIRVSQESRSAFGCSATYNISVKGEGQTYLPFLIR